MKPRIALIFKVFGHPLQLAWAEWARDLHASAALEVGVFAHSAVSFPGTPPVTLVGRGNRASHMRALMSSPMRLARVGARTVGGGAQRLRSRIGAALDYAPLLDFTPDVICLVHVQLYPQYADLFDTLACGLISCYRGYDVQVRPGQDPTWHDALRRLALRSGRLHFVSRGLQLSHTQLLPLSELQERRRVIYHGVDTEFFSPGVRRTPSGGRIRLLSVGRLTWEKGHIYALRALRVLLDQGRQAHLSIIGDGPEKEHLAFWVRRLRLEENVSMPGFMAQDQIRDHLRECDIYLQPSLSEGLPGTAIEASAVGLPIIATSIGGFPEVIQNNRNGVLVSPGEHSELAAAIARLTDDVGLRDELGRRARERILQDFSVVSRTRSWHELIEDARSAGKS